MQELVLGRSQFDERPGAPHIAGFLVEVEIRVAQTPLARTDPGRPAEHGLHALDELLDAEWLGHVIVAAEA